MLSYFSQRPSDILVVNYIRDESAATKISSFLGYGGEHSKPKKHLNPIKTTPLIHTEMLKTCVTDLGLPECELKYDIYCPTLVSEDEIITFPADSGMLESNRK